VLESSAWERFIAKDTHRREKIVACVVTNTIKAKRKLGMTCKSKQKRSTKINGVITPKKKKKLKEK